MSIRPVEINGMLQRTMDVGTIKQQEDQKPLVDQQNYMFQSQAQEVREKNQVQGMEKSTPEYDLRDKEKRERNSQKKKQDNDKKKNHAEDRMIVKTNHAGFDMKV